MTDKELSKLNRKELLEILLEISKENDSLREEIETLKSEIKKKDEVISQTGSLSDVINKLHESMNHVSYVKPVEDQVIYEKPIEQKYSEEEITEEVVEEITEEEVVEETVLEVISNDIPHVKTSRDSQDKYWDELVNRLETFVTHNELLKDVIDMNMFKDGDYHE